MAAPTYQVIVYFGTSTTGAGSFILDHPTAGLLDSVSYLLGGDAGTDVAGDAISIKVNRGRSSQIFSAFNAGTATVQLNNEDRMYDPLYTAGSLAGNLKPGKRVTIIASGVTIFDGRIADWQLAFDVNGRSIATMVCEDALATLARKQFAAWTGTASETSGARVTSVLNRAEVSWSGAARAVDTGRSTMQADSISAGTNALNYLQTVARAENGALFASRTGLVTFKDRTSLFTSTATVQFDASNTNIPFQTVGVTSGMDTYYTRVQVTRTGGTTQAYQMPSATTDDIVSLSLDGLPLADDTQAYEMASYLANVYSSGDARISSVGTNVNDQILTTTEINQLLSTELTDLITLTWAPNNVGTPVAYTCIVDGITHDAFPGRHTVTLQLGPATSRQPFTLDSATFGLLDGTSLLVF
jgi:hypothetical protein